jgi:hypothetical protein
MRALPIRSFTRDFPRVRGEALTVTSRGRVVGIWTPSPTKPKLVNFEERVRKDFKTMLPFTGAELLKEGKKR